MTENKGDLISRSELKKAIMFKTGILEETWEQLYDSVLEEIDNAPTVNYPFYQEAYQTGYEEGKNERLQVTVFAENASKEELEDFKKELEKVVRRPQGEWIEVDIKPTPYGGYTCNYKCNRCKYFTKEYHLNFCPNCGTDMRGGTK